MPAAVPSLTDAEALDADMANDWAHIREHGVAPDSDGDGVATADPADGAGEAAATGNEPADAAAPAPAAVRDPATGKFQKPARTATTVADPPAAAAAAADPAAAANVQPPAADSAAGVDAQGRPLDINRAPSSWKPAERAEWNKLSPLARAAIHRRESDFLKGSAELRAGADYAREMQDTIRPFEMLIQSEGGTPVLAVKDMMMTAALLRTGTPQQKYDTIARIAHRYGLDLRIFGRQAAPGGGQQPQPPGGGQQPQQFRDSRVDDLIRAQQTAEQQRVAAEQAQMEATANTWLNETDAAGNPKRPYAFDVIEEVTALIPRVKAQNPLFSHAQVMDKAYEQAIWANPEIRTLLQAQAQQAAGPSAAEIQLRAQGARRAASANVTRRASVPSTGKPGTLEETLTETARDLGLIPS